ncbi:MAG: hypothetical protein H7210_10820 [Pyrinomonadaceae bacterium]|nr:hypothetical protein [Phycisphaerales bacterium]
MRRAILFHDGLGVLSPLTDLRPAWAIRTGAMRTKERLERAIGVVVVRAECEAGMVGIAAEITSDVAMVGQADGASGEGVGRSIVHAPVDLAGEVLFVNARCALPYEGMKELKLGECIREAGSGDLVAACGVGSDVDELAAGFSRPAGTAGPPKAGRAWTCVAELAAPALLSRPWHVKTFRDRCLAMDLELIRGTDGWGESGAALQGDLALGGPAVPAGPGAGAAPLQTELPGVTIITGRAVKLAGAMFNQPVLSNDAKVKATGGTPVPSHRAIIHPTAKVYPTACFDIEHGSVVIDAHATVRPGALVIGPAYIGPYSTVLDKALIKPGTAIGPHCKVAGEVGGTIFQGFANKAHDGHLGDSYVGEWANLGAGTMNSNLLNTYGEVVSKARVSDSNERTGEQFLGCIVGDHVKFAISTRIMTGAVIHTGTMWAAGAAVSGCVAGFSWVTEAGAKPFRLEKFLEVMRAAMGRRKIVPSAAYVKRVEALGRP